MFGQDKDSWKEFRKTYSDIDGITRSGELICDPLLGRLCGQKWEKERQFYKDLDANEAPSHYRAQDFPFLGSRLLRLQNFSKHQEPHDWKVLWYDRRDISMYYPHTTDTSMWTHCLLVKSYTFWAVLFFGGGTLLVTLIQLIVQIVLSAEQLKEAKEQNRLQRLSIPP